MRESAVGETNCGRNAMKNSATLGFSTFVRRPGAENRPTALVREPRRRLGEVAALEEHLRSAVAEIRGACHLHARNACVDVAEDRATSPNAAALHGSAQPRHDAEHGE